MNLSISDEDHSGEDKLEEGVREVEEDPEERNKLLEQLKQTYKTRRKVKRRNELLKRCLKEFFQKRKLDHVCKEQDTSSQSAQIEAAYENKLHNYNKLTLNNLREIQEKESEEKVQEEEKTKMEEKWRELFETLKQTEVEKANGLMIMTGWKKEKRENMMKKFSKLIDSQRTAYETEGTAKSSEIRLREKIRSNELKLKRIENIADDIHILDYERVQADNVRIQTKIDDKLSELRKIKANNVSSETKISELQKKISTVQRHTEALSANLTTSHETIEEISSTLKKTISIRNKNLHTSQQLTDKAGLNLFPRLLADYKEKHTKLIEINEEINQLTETLDETRNKIDKLETSALQVKIGRKTDEKLSEKAAATEILDRYRLQNRNRSHWSRSKSRSSDDSSTIQSSLSLSFNAKKLLLLDA
uniref:CCDC113/CCDC96 coiled-coil domain-containing protein n=1 Tax=Cacopsylla melanoneura TaxID=428564 RepID=A0A8D8XD79_9HEMI